MRLNEFLNFKLGVFFEDKYNELAIKEIKNNPNNYKSIYEYIEDMDDPNEDNSFFDCDDYELCCKNYQMLELYYAFVKVLLDDVKNKKKKLTYASFSTKYYPDKSINSIINQINKPKVVKTISCNSKCNTIEMSVYSYFNRVNLERVYTAHKSEISNNETFLKEIKDNLLIVNKMLNFANIRLSDDELDGNVISFNDETLYWIDSYEFNFNRNRFFLLTTERGFDPLSIRLKLFEHFKIKKGFEMEVEEILYNTMIKDSIS